jgi:hypothetical protein
MNIHSPNLVPGFVSWAKYFADAATCIPPVETRLAVPISEDAIFSLLDFGFDHAPDPQRIGWDLRRLMGDAGRGALAEFVAHHGTPEECLRPYDPARDGVLLDDGPTTFLLCDSAAYIDRLWSTFDRERVESDRLIIDEMDEAIWAGWEAPPEIAAAVEKLRDVFEEKQAQRLAEETPMPGPSKAADAVSFEDFGAYSPSHSYFFVPTGEHWPASTVNTRLPRVQLDMAPKPILASTYLDRTRSVEQATWAPGQPQVIEDRLISEGGWFTRAGCKTFNLYRPPTIKPKAGDASPWINHIRWIYPDEADHIIKWLAQRVQHPDQKINHALVLGGTQGIGKDTMLEPVKAAVGPWNCSEVSPQQVLGRFNSFVKSVILRVSEARDLGETDRFAYYEHLKTLTAAPPDVLRVDEKHLREHAVLNVVGVIQTTNNKDALHLPADDRRHFVAWSPRTKEDFPSGYWTGIYQWFAAGGNEIVAHYLAALDLSDFNAKAPPPKTRAFWEIVDASRAPEDAEMADAIDALGKPDAVTVQDVLSKASLKQIDLKGVRAIEIGAVEWVQWFFTDFTAVAVENETGVARSAAVPQPQLILSYRPLPSEFPKQKGSGNGSGRPSQGHTEDRRAREVAAGDRRRRPAAVRSHLTV